MGNYFIGIAMNKHEAAVDFIGNNVRRYMYINVKVCKKQNVC